MKTGVKVGNAMTRKPVTVTPETSLLKCAKIMLRKRVGSLIIKERDKDKVLGIITEKDLVRKVVAKKVDPAQTNVSTVMTTDIMTIAPNEDLYDAIYFMSRYNVRRLPVIENGKLIGFLTNKDVLKIQPDLYDICAEKMKIRESRRKPNARDYMEGICAKCGTHGQLFKYRKKFICEACRKI